MAQAIRKAAGLDAVTFGSALGLPTGQLIRSWTSNSGEARAGWGALPRGASSTIRRGCRWLSWPNRRIILVALSLGPATPTLPLPATRLRRAGGGRSEKPKREASHGGFALRRRADARRQGSSPADQTKSTSLACIAAPFCRVMVSWVMPSPELTCQCMASSGTNVEPGP